MKKLFLFVLVLLIGGTAWLWFSDSWQRIPAIEHLIGPYVSKLSAPSSPSKASSYASPPLPVAGASGVVPSSHCQCPPQHQCPAQQQSPVGQPPAAPMGHPMMPPQAMPVQQPPPSSAMPTTPMHPMSAPYPGTATTQVPAMGHPVVRPPAPAPVQQPQAPVPVPSGQH